MKFGYKRCALIFAVLLLPKLAFSETLEEYVEKCKEALEIDLIPGYDCSDGIPLTSTESANLLVGPKGTVTVGRVVTSNPAVDAIFLCRNISGSTVQLDGYILQNRENGKTCFFDKKLNSSTTAPDLDFSTPEKAALANSEWKSIQNLYQGGDCLDCHNNDPFIISESLSRAASELGLIGTARPMAAQYEIVETEDYTSSPLYDGNNKILTDLGFGPGNCASSCHTVGGDYDYVISGMPATPGSHFLSWPTGRILHDKSAKCIHPEGGTAFDGTKAVLWSSCDDEARLRFEFTAGGKIREKASNKCLDIDSVSLLTNVKYRSDCSSAAQFHITHFGQIKLTEYNFCIEPASSTPVNGTELVLYYCTGLEEQNFASIPVRESRITQFTSGMCWRTEDGSPYPASNKRNVVLSNSCSDGSSAFTLLNNGMIKHIPSGYCVHPEGGTAQQMDNFVLTSSCNYDANSVFEVTEYGSVKHAQTGLCAHPYLGSATPSEGTEVIFHSGCNSGSDDRLKFLFNR